MSKKNRHAHREARRDREGTAVWVRTDPRLLEPGYSVVIEVGRDAAYPLTPKAALAHAQAVLSVTQRIRYDAAVVRQLAQRVTPSHAAAMVEDLRLERPDITSWPTPLTLAGGVAMDGSTEFRPFLVVSHRDEPIGQWEPSDALSHATHLLEAPEAADLDASYAKVLTSLVGVSEDVARFMVGDLARHRGAGRAVTPSGISLAERSQIATSSWPQAEPQRRFTALNGRSRALPAPRQSSLTRSPEPSATLKSRSISVSSHSWIVVPACRAPVKASRNSRRPRSQPFL